MTAALPANAEGVNVYYLTRDDSEAFGLDAVHAVAVRWSMPACRNRRYMPSGLVFIKH